MAVTSTFGVTNSDVLDELPLDTTNVDATSKPVTTGQIDAWIDEAAGVIHAILDSHGLGDLSGDDDAKQVAIRAVKSFAAARVLFKMNRATGLAEQMWAEWSEGKEIIRNRPQDLGEAQTDTARVLTNVDTGDPKDRTFVAYNDDRGDGFTGW